MKKRSLILTGVIGCIFILILFIYPNVSFYRGDYLYLLSYGRTFDKSEDLEELEGDMCYAESYSYNSKRDISITSWEYKGIWPFKYFKVKYKDGNICSTEFLLEESYINYFLENAEIIENEDNINLAKLIDGKDAIVGNIRYPWNDEHSYLGYNLDGKYVEMFVYKSEGLLIIQVGSRDEGAKFIAYK